ncbi:MAG: MBL fold metallo-hydrolase, partial [Acidimicrobiia bacterium]
MNITRLLAPNPGPFTGAGTNTYVIESAGEALIIDPGPVDDSHFDVIRDALVELDPVGVAVTHTHSDHAPAANPLAVELEVPAYGFAPGPGFEPDVRVSDGQEIGFGTEAAVGLHTPGHSADHLCYRARDVLFTGDHIMGGSTVVVEDMVSYLSSLRRLQGLGLKALFPGHGPKIDDPERVIAEYLEHRMQRER